MIVKSLIEIELPLRDILDIITGNNNPECIKGHRSSKSLTGGDDDHHPLCENTMCNKLCYQQGGCTGGSCNEAALLASS